jgi:post-segregation antitoxin (ccd killing protein)
VVDLGFPELTTDQIEQLCQIAENTARQFILSKISSKQVQTLDIVVEVEGEKPVNVSVEVNLVLLPKVQGIDVDSLVREATSQAQQASENYLRKLT